MPFTLLCQWVWLRIKASGLSHDPLTLNLTTRWHALIRRPSWSYDALNVGYVAFETFLNLCHMRTSWRMGALIKGFPYNRGAVSKKLVKLNAHLEISALKPFWLNWTKMANSRVNTWTRAAISLLFSIWEINLWECKQTIRGVSLWL